MFMAISIKTSYVSLLDRLIMDVWSKNFDCQCRNPGPEPPNPTPVWGGIITEYPIIHKATRGEIKKCAGGSPFSGKDTNRLRNDHRVHTLSRYNMISTIFLALVRSNSKTQVVDHKSQMPTRDPTAAHGVITFRASSTSITISSNRGRHQMCVP
jgi:hypothetical protein